MKIMKKLMIIITAILLLMLVNSKVSAEETTMKLTLPEAIAIARTQSVDAVVARGELKSAYWEYKSYMADLLPELTFEGTLPQYNKRYSSYQQDDGSYKFVRNDWFGINGALNVKQNIWLTGGSLSLTSSLDYIKTDGMKNFMSVPVSLTLSQPIFGVNNYKWKRRIQPVKYREAKAAFISATEEVTMKTIQYFFNLLLARENVNIAQQNLKNATRLYEIAEARRKMGQVSESDLLQLKLSALNAQSTLTDNESSLNSNLFQLKAFLNISDSTKIDLQMPESMPTMNIRYADVLDKALENNAFALNVRRRQLEADYAVATAKGNLRSIKFTATVGYSGIGNDKLRYAYNTLKDNAIVSVGVSIPILDWGKRRGEVRVAESNREVTQSKLRQEQQTFNQDVFLLVEHFNNQSKQLDISTQADSIAQKRYKTSIETFMIGKINTLDLNDAQVNKDEARQKNISELFYYWYYYYQLRSLTLWDFAQNKGIDADFDDIIKK